MHGSLFAGCFYIGETAVWPKSRFSSKTQKTPAALPATPASGHSFTVRFTDISYIILPLLPRGIPLCEYHHLFLLSPVGCVQFGAGVSKAVMNICICFHLSWVVSQSYIVSYSNLQGMRVSLVPYSNQWWNYAWGWKGLQRIFLPFPPFGSNCGFNRSNSSWSSNTVGMEVRPGNSKSQLNGSLSKKSVFANVGAS